MPKPVSKNSKTWIAVALAVFVVVIAILNGIGNVETAAAVWQEGTNHVSLQIAGRILGHKLFVPAVLLLCAAALIWLLVAIQQERGQPPDPPTEDKRLAAMQRLLKQASGLARGRSDRPYGNATEAIAGAYLFHKTIPGFLDRAFELPKSREYADFLESQKQKLGDSYRVEQAAADYLNLLSGRITDRDVSFAFPMPESFEQFDPEKWPASRFPDIQIRDRKEIYEEQKAKRVTAAQWRQMESRFKALPHDIRADYSVITPDDKSKPISTEWRIAGGESGVQECGALCGVAGNMLLRSPGVKQTLSAAVRAINDPGDRWLEFLRETYGIPNSSYGSGTYYGETHTSWDGRYDDLPTICARACIDNEAKEI